MSKPFDLTDEQKAVLAGIHDQGWREAEALLNTLELAAAGLVELGPRLSGFCAGLVAGELRRRMDERAKEDGQ